MLIDWSPVGGRRAGDGGGVRVGHLANDLPGLPQPRSYRKRALHWNLSGNEVYDTNPSILRVKDMLCSELHCQEAFSLSLSPGE